MDGSRPIPTNKPPMGNRCRQSLGEAKKATDTLALAEVQVQGWGTLWDVVRILDKETLRLGGTRCPKYMHWNP